MPLARGDKEYVLPMRGINSEANLLHFPQEFAVDALNMEVDYDPQVVRPRKGLSETNLARLIETRTAGDHDVGISTFLWENVAEDPQTNFVVIQVGRYVYFFDDDNITDATTAAFSTRIDLNDVISGTVEGTLALLEPSRCDFAQIKGNLIITNNAIDPCVISYDASTSAFTLTELELQIRDLFGIDDGLEVAERPSTTLTDDHRYNLYNQGWYKQRRLTSGSPTESDPITEFNTVHSPLYPSNADIAHLGMVESSGDLIFDAEWLKDQTFGGSPAPKGHFVLDAFNMDRATLLGSPQSGTGGAGGTAVDQNWQQYPEEAF